MHTNGADAGLSNENTTAYEIRVDTTTKGIYMRDGENKEWIQLGSVASQFGITPASIDAVENGGGVKKLGLGLEAEAPTTGNNTYDLYFARDKKRLLIWMGMANVDLTGSAGALRDNTKNYPIEFQNLRDGHAIVFNSSKKKFVNRRRFGRRLDLPADN